MREHLSSGWVIWEGGVDIAKLPVKVEVQVEGNRGSQIHNGISIRPYISPVKHSLIRA
jgi:hypothetical protein